MRIHALPGVWRGQTSEKLSPTSSLNEDMYSNNVAHVSGAASRLRAARRGSRRSKQRLWHLSGDVV